MAVDRAMLSMQEVRQKFDQLERQSFPSAANLPSSIVVDQ